MHVAVAGGAGDLGSAVVRAFTALGVPTTALVHPRTDAWRLSGVPGVEIARVDLRDTASVAHALGTHHDLVVVDAAGRSGHPGTARGPSRVALWRDTVLTTVSLLDAIDPANVRSVLHLGKPWVFLLRPDAAVWYLATGLRNPTSHDYPLASPFGPDGQQILASRLASGRVRYCCWVPSHAGALAPTHLEEYVATLPVVAQTRAGTLVTAV